MFLIPVTNSNVSNARSETIIKESVLHNGVRFVLLEKDSEYYLAAPTDKELKDLKKQKYKLVAKKADEISKKIRQKNQTLSKYFHETLLQRSNYTIAKYSSYSLSASRWWKKDIKIEAALSVKRIAENQLNSAQNSSQKQELDEDQVQKINEQIESSFLGDQSSFSYSFDSNQLITKSAFKNPHIDKDIFLFLSKNECPGCVA